MSSQRVATALAFIVLVAATGLAQVDKVAEALQRKDFATAARLAEEAAQSSKGTEREYSLYRRGLALALAEKHAEAIQQFETQLKEFPDGVWTHKARFRLADAHAALKQFDQAERVYGEEVRSLIGDARKAKLAQVYQDFAEEYFTPKDSLIKPDYTKARTFYEKALELEPGPELRDSILYRRAQCNQKLAAWPEAAQQYHDYLIRFDAAYRETQKLRFGGAPLPAMVTEHGKSTLAARYGLAECQLAQNQMVDARRTLQDLLTVLDSGVGDPSRAATVRERVPSRASGGGTEKANPLPDGRGSDRSALTLNANYLLSKTYGMPKPADAGMLTLGVQTLDKLIKTWPESQKAVQAAHDIATAYMNLSRSDDAIAAFRALVDRTEIRPNDDETRKLAETLSQDALFCIGRLLFQQKEYDEAIGIWNQYVARYPSGPHWSASQQAILDAEYQIGADRIADKKYDEGRAAWEAFLQKHPLDARAPDILFAFGDLALREQVERQKSKQSPDWNTPIALWRKLVSKYPGTEQAGKGQFYIAYTLEFHARDLEAAIEEYTKLNWSSFAAQAQARLADMRSTRLTVVTERTFRTDEPTRVHVDVRNVDTLTVKMFRLDMEDFFRKSHSLTGVDGLDLLLIDPDRTIEIPVKEFGKYKPISQDIDLPFDGPAVYAVLVTNENSKLATTSGINHAKLSATTLLVRSDIDLIVKSSRRQMLVFAQNMLTGKPAAGVDVLVAANMPAANPADGGKTTHKVFLSGKTGDDGVWLGKSDDLKNVQSPLVLAMSCGNIAGAGLSLESLGVSAGLSARGYLYTDRPAYRPGEAVNIRGILREVKDGQYALPTQPDDPMLRWRLDVVDAKGRVLRSDAIRMTGFGTFSAQFRITPDAPVGSYKLIARRPDGPTFTGEFLVQTFDLPKAFAIVELAEPVVLRGQPIKGSLVVKYQYGEPVAGKPVEYTLSASNGEVIQRSGVTDKDGKIAFEFDSTTLPEDASAVVSARQADLGIAAQAVVTVAVRAFRAAVRTQRPLYLSEEPVEVTLNAWDLKGGTIAQEMTLTALHRTSADGRWAETKAESAKLTTDEKTGAARMSFKLTKGGQYVLRAEGLDKFGHVVTAEASVQISAEDDETRLRLFSERETYKVGETIALDIHSRIRWEDTEHRAATVRERVLSLESGQVDGEKNPLPDGRGSDVSRPRPPLLALVTFEGEEIIGYRTVAVAAGHNALEIPLTHGHFPNFAVGASVMAGNKFFSASREFAVQRQLKVVLAPKAASGRDPTDPSRAPDPSRAATVRERVLADGAEENPLPDGRGSAVFRPRDEIEVEVSVTDHLDKPVKAEVGISMIDNALLTKFPDRTPEIVGFFNNGARRQAALRTETSCTFRFAANTKPLVTELLAEAERVRELATGLVVQLPAAQTAAPGRPAAPNASAGGRRGGGNFVGRIVGGQAPNESAAGGQAIFGGGGSGGADVASLGYAGVADDEQMQLESSNVYDFDSVLGDSDRQDLGEKAKQLLRQSTAGKDAREGRFAGRVPVLGDIPMVEQLARNLRDLDAARGEYQLGATLNDQFPQHYAVNAANYDKAVANIAQNAPPRTYFPEVAYWNPHVTTDDTGKATVRIVLPDSSTKWKLIARGVTPETLVGGGESEVTAKQDFFVELITPPTLVEGDSFRPLARVHCLTAYEGGVRVTLRANAGLQDGVEPQMEVKRELKIAAAGVYDVEFGDIPLADEKRAAPTVHELQLSIEAVTLAGATAGAGSSEPQAQARGADARTTEPQAQARGAQPVLRDGLVRAIPIRPWGDRVEFARAGVGRDSDFVELELPLTDVRGSDKAGELRDRLLTLVVGASMPRWLIEEALETGPRWVGIHRHYGAGGIAPPRTNADVASALVGCLYAADYMRARLPATNPNRAATVRERVPGRSSDEPASSRARLGEERVAEERNESESNDAQRLNDRIAGLAAQLIAAQNDDGGLAWCGKGPSNPWTSSLAAWAIGKARRDGFRIADDGVNKLTAYLQATFAAAAAEQTELKAITLHGLSWISEADFAHANRLYRQRDSLSAASLAHLTLTFLRLDRKPIAAELLGVLEHRLSDANNGRTPGKCLPATGCSDWMSSTLEVTSLALLAQLSVDSRNANVQPMVNYLVGAIRTDGWRPHKARGAVLSALCTYYGGSKQEAAAFELSVLLNGVELKKLTADDGGSIRIEVPADKLPAGKQRIDFRFAGRGEYAWAASLSGFAKAFPNPIGDGSEPCWAEQRWYEPPPREYKGRAVPTGFGVTTRSRWYANRAAKVPQGKVIRVQVNLGRHEPRSLNAAGDGDYFVVRETIPAGFRFVEGSLTGAFQTYELADNVLTMFYGSTPHLGTIQYHLVATTPGVYRVPPTLVRSLYRPERFNVNKTDTITVLPREQKSDDAYRATPDELYNLARMHFDDGAFDSTKQFLDELLAAKDWTLADEPYRESIRMLLSCALARNDDAGIVNYFEILKEKYPTLLVPFDQITRVASAYAKTNQAERAFLIYRATADASFSTDTAIGGVLQGEGRFLEGVDFLEKLWLEYPDTPQIESLNYAFAQTLYAQAENVAAIQQRRKGKAVFAAWSGGELPAKVTKAAILNETIASLERFVTLHPTSPIVDEASYSLANAYLDLDQFDTVLARTQRMIETFPKSKWLDRYRYIQALAHFHIGNFDQARALADEVAAAKFKDEQGVERPSPNRWLALYIIGQIHHAKGETAQAIEYYKKVKDQFSDAAEALGWFERRFVQLPEVTIFHPDGGGYRESVEWQRHLRARKQASGVTVKPGLMRSAALVESGGAARVVPVGSNDGNAAQPAASAAGSPPLYSKPFIELGYRNLKSAVLQVYRVDLMKLALIEKNLTQITAVNLAGIKPLVEKTVTLGDGLEYLDKSLRVDVDVADLKNDAGDADKSKAKDATGAYLIICRGEDLFASGLVLVTPLALEVQEETGSPRVRVSVVDAISRATLKDVHVKVIGLGMTQFVSGETDLRGVFAAEGVSGYPTAIARNAKGHFAFHRSEGAMLAMAAPKPGAPQSKMETGQKADYRSNLNLENRRMQMENDARMQQIYKTPQKRGVEVQKAQ